LARAVQAPGESVGAFFERREREAGLGPSGVSVSPAARAARPAAGPAKNAQNFLGMQTGDTGFGLPATRADLRFSMGGGPSLESLAAPAALR
jgi:hypothetical protein